MLHAISTKCIVTVSAVQQWYEQCSHAIQAYVCEDSLSYDKVMHSNEITSLRTVFFIIPWQFCLGCGTRSISNLLM